MGRAGWPVFAQSTIPPARSARITDSGTRASHGPMMAPIQALPGTTSLAENYARVGPSDDILPVLTSFKMLSGPRVCQARPIRVCSVFIQDTACQAPSPIPLPVVHQARACQGILPLPPGCSFAAVPAGLRIRPARPGRPAVTELELAGRSSRTWIPGSTL